MLRWLTHRGEDVQDVAPQDQTTDEIASKDDLGTKYDVKEREGNVRGESRDVSRCGEVRWVTCARTDSKWRCPPPTWPHSPPIGRGRGELAEALAREGEP